MIPDGMPKSIWIIYLTGLLEILGAVGLVYPPTRRTAAICLILLLVMMFPANINAALNDASLRGKPPTPLFLRAPLQVLFIGLLIWTGDLWPGGRSGQGAN